MPSVRFITFDGTQHEVKASEGQSLMRVATDHSVPGIDGDCGGACACGTCHVYVDEAWADKLNAVDAMEDSMLDFTDCRRPNSRLSCQITMVPALDGLTVSLPEGQH